MSGFIDTSMVVRYLTGDVPVLAHQAATVIDEQDNLWICGVALAEAYYVLRSVYLLSWEIVVDHLMEFLGKQNISCYALDKGMVIRALLMCRQSGRVSVADGLIWAAARTSGRNVVYSLDQRFPAGGVEVRRGI